MASIAAILGAALANRTAAGSVRFGRLTPKDLTLYDNNVPQAIPMDWMTYPIDLVVAVETSSNSGAVVDKLGGSGILFTQLPAADAGETAVISFSDEVKVHQDFTGNPDFVIHALRMLRQEGGEAHMLDALRQALIMLERRPPGRRRIILMIAERRDRSSNAKLPEVTGKFHAVRVEVRNRPELEAKTREGYWAL